MTRPEPDQAPAPGNGAYLGLAGAILPGSYLLVTSTTRLAPGLWPYDAKRILQFALLMILFALPLVDRDLRAALSSQVAAVPAWIKATLLAIAGWGVLSALVHSQSPMHAANSLSEVALMSALVLAVFVIAACRRVSGGRFDQIAIGLLALTGLAVGMQELLGVVAAHASGVDFTYRISLLHYSWPRFFNQVQSWMIPALVALPWLFPRQRLASILCLVALGLQWYILLMTGARGAFVSLVAGMGLMVLVVPALRKPLLRWQLGGLLLGALIYGAVLYSFERSGSEPTGITSVQQTESSGEGSVAGLYGNEDGSKSGFLAQSLGRPMANTSSRDWMWRTSLRDALQNPLLGIGPMNYVCTANVRMSHPHSFPLRFLAEWGFPAMLALMMVFLAPGVRILRQLRGQSPEQAGDRFLSGCLMASVVCAALYACLSGVLIMPASQVAGVMIFGGLLGMSGLAGRREGYRGARKICTSGALMSMLLLVLGWFELSTMDSRSEKLRPGDDLLPRIWQDAMVCRHYTGLLGVVK